MKLARRTAPINKVALMDLVAAGNSTALGCLYDACGPSLYRLAQVVAQLGPVEFKGAAPAAAGGAGNLVPTCRSRSLSWNPSHRRITKFLEALNSRVFGCPRGGVGTGQGAYANERGNNKYRVLGQGFGCDENQPPEVFFLQIVAKGPLSY